jgi:hypothetical protein
MKNIISILIIITGITNSINAQNIWRGNDYLANPDWRQNGWGLVAWNSNLQIVTNGFWGYDDIMVVPDPYDVNHDVIRVRFEEDGVTTESGAGLLFAPNLSFLQNPKKACLSYNILLDNDFEWGTVGGKFPGLYGLDPSQGIPTAETCVGPVPIESNRCFSTRMEWRILPNQGYDSTRMFYELIPWMNEDTCHANWICDLPYGSGMVMLNSNPPSFEAVHGTWANIKHEVLLNDAGMSNGYMRVWYNDILVYDEQGLKIVTDQNVNIYGILFHTLFGQGFDLSQGSPTTQFCYLSDFEIADSYSDIINATGINSEPLNTITELKVYPNPTDMYVNISFTSLNEQDIELHIYNSVGQEIFNDSQKNFSGTYTNQMNLDHFSGAFYMLEIKTELDVYVSRIVTQ